MKYVSIDFEFNRVLEPKVNLVCCSLQVIEDKVPGKIEEYWLYNSEFNPLINRLNQLKDHIFIAHQASAEARCFLALGLNPLDFKWICTFAEWRMATNHNSKFRYGKHLINNKIKTLIHPRLEKYGDDQSYDKLKHSLSEMVFKLINHKIDNEHKTKMRNIIIADKAYSIESNQEEIQRYCSSDIVYLYQCLKMIVLEYRRHYLPEDQKLIFEEMLYRGRCMTQVSFMENIGYPIDYEATKNFSKSIRNILADCQADINTQFPEMEVFSYNAKTHTYTRKEKPIREWIESTPYASEWEKTNTGRDSLSLEAFKKFYNYKHDFPRGNFGAQMVRFLKLKQSLNGFSVNNKKRTLWDYVGEDKRVRPNFNPFGSQSARFQPAATGFLFLKAAWMRALCVPPRGRAIAGIDYKSQEYLIAALESKDPKMISGYHSGDVYLAYAKDTGIAPKNATKESHGKERNLAKSTVLGILFDMSKYGLAKELTEKSGKDVSVEEAQEYIDLFYETYHYFAEFKERVQFDYQKKGYLKSPMGWTMFGDNPNFRSVGNFIIQSAGASILWRAIDNCHRFGLDVVIPLHDALYIECDIGEPIDLMDFHRYMKEAFDYYYPDSGIMLDGEIWSPEFERGELKVGGVKFKQEQIHIDERSAREYEFFKKYFISTGAEYL